MSNGDPKDTKVKDIKRRRLRPIYYDRPIDQIMADLLWQDDQIQYDFYRVARQIVDPLFSNDTQGASTTFAIYGKWGMGKSSALRLIQQRAHQLASSEAQRAGQQFDSRRLMFCHYPAPAYDSEQHSVRATLMFRMLAKLTEHDPAAMKIILDSLLLAGVRPEDLIPGSSTESADLIKNRRVLANIAVLERVSTKLSDLLDFDNRLDAYLNGTLMRSPDQGVTSAATSASSLSTNGALVTHQSEPGNSLAVRPSIVPPADPPAAPRVMVVLLDDLDRCRVEFLEQVLRTIHSWSDVRNLFFILAVRQENLRKAVERQLDSDRDDPNYALEKYVQFSLSVPTMDSVQLQRFLSQLFKSNIADTSGVWDPDHLVISIEALADASTDPVEQTIVAGVGLLEYALTVVTPRSVKRCLNEIESALDNALEDLQDQKNQIEQQRVLKKVLLEYSWRDQYTRWFPKQRDLRSNVVHGFLADLEKAFAQSAWLMGGASDSEWLRFAWEQSASRFDEPTPYEERLARFLSTPPYWFVEPPSINEMGLSTTIPSWVPTVGSLQGADGASVNTVSEAGEDPRTLLNRLYVLSERAEATQDRQAALTYADQVYLLVTSRREAFSRRDCATVGNVAITAERFGAHNLATRLYQLAVDLDPNHANNLQNFVDFIVKEEIRDLYEDAQRYIQQLKSGAAARHRPERTLVLEAQLNTLMGEPDRPVITPEQLQQVVEDFARNPGNQSRFAAVISLLDQLERYEDMERVVRIYYEAATDDESRYFALRVLADALAGSQPTRNELLAMDIYAYLLRSPSLSSQTTDRNRADMLHNFATLLYKYDYDSEAGRLWYQAYHDRPTDPSIQRVYSQYLLRSQKTDQAALVVEGKPLDQPMEELLDSRGQSLPPRFLEEDIERWWETPRVVSPSSTDASNQDKPN